MVNALRCEYTGATERGGCIDVETVQILDREERALAVIDVRRAETGGVFT